MSSDLNMSGYKEIKEMKTRRWVFHIVGKEMNCPRCNRLITEEEIDGMSVMTSSDAGSICNLCADKEYEADTEYAMEWAE